MTRIRFLLWVLISSTALGQKYWDDDGYEWDDDWTDDLSYTNSEDETKTLAPTTSPTKSPTPFPSSPPTTSSPHIKTSCSDYHSSTFILDFSYSVETSTDDEERVISLLDEALTRELAHELLPCNNVRRHLRSERQWSDDDVVAIASHPKDEVSQTRGCLPALDKSNRCFVVNGGITIALGEFANADEVKYVFLSRIMYYMVNGLFIGSIDGLAKVSYREPSFSNPIAQAKADDDVPVTPVRDSSNALPITAAILTFLILTGGTFAAFYIGRHHRQKRLLEGRGMELTDDGSCSANTAPVTPPQSPPKSPEKQQQKKYLYRHQRRRKRKGRKPDARLGMAEMRIPSLLQSSDLSVIAEERSVDENSTVFSASVDEDANSRTDSCDSSSVEGDEGMESIFEDVCIHSEDEGETLT